MLKKGIILIVAVSYLLLTSGVVVNAHYCMNQFASVSFYSDSQSECGRCGMDIHSSNGCCHDEIGMAKINDDHHSSANINYVAPLIEALPICYSPYLASPLYMEQPSKHFLNHSPPLISQSDTYLRNSVFRI